MGTEARYDRIGTTYGRFRHTEPSWMAEIDAALGDAETVLNIGAGTGNYEEGDRRLFALEPSRTMIDQRRAGAAPAVQGVAEALPFADDSFDAAMGVLTMHHWADQLAGLHEAARVAPQQVFVVYETEAVHRYWLVDYFPEIASTKVERDAPGPDRIATVLDVVQVRTLWVPRDCAGGFATASWARPADYLDPDRQQSVSPLALAPPDVLARGTEALRRDIESGAWHERYADLLKLDRADFGYRLVICRRS